MKNVLRCIRMRAHAASAIAPDGRTLKMALEPERDHANDKQYTLESVV